MALSIEWTVPLALVIASSAVWAFPQRDLKKTPDGSAIIRGRVVAADTGLPIRDAMVGLVALDGRPGVSFPAGLPPDGASLVDADGGFELTGIAAGKYRLLATPGSLSLRYLATRHPDPASEAPQPLIVTSGQTLNAVEIRMPRAGAISGRVLSENGEPFGMTFVIAVEALPGGRHRIQQGGGAAAAVRTDDTGSFRVFGLRPGRYYLLAQPLRPSPMAALTQTNEYAPTYFPGTQSIRDATPIDVRHGDDYGGIDLVITRGTRLLTVSGIVLDPEGQPASGVTARFERGVLPDDLSTPAGVNVPGPFSVAFTRASDAEGVFRINGLPVGENTLMFHRYAGAGEFASVPLSIAADLDGLVVRLQRGITVTGRVHFEGTAPSSHGTLQVRAIPIRPIGLVKSTGVQPGPDGSFALEHQFGPLLIRADGLQGWHLRAVQHAARDITNVPTEFSTGGSDVELILTRSAASVTGTVRSPAGAPTEGAVVLFSENPTLWFERATTSKLAPADGNGRFRLEGLGPGRYLAVALPAEQASLSGAPRAFFELLASRATVVEVEGSEQKAVELNLTSLATPQ